MPAAQHRPRTKLQLRFDQWRYAPRRYSGWRDMCLQHWLEDVQGLHATDLKWYPLRMRPRKHAIHR